MVVGWFGNREAFRWENGEFIGLGDLPGGWKETQSEAVGVSLDGRVIIGNGQSDAGTEAVVWGELSIENLGGRWATGISGDGLVITGFRQLENGTMEAVTWVDGAISPVGGRATQAWAISSDGSTVVGDNFISKNGTIFGIGDLDGGGLFTRARAVSSTGLAVVGEAQSEAGTEAFLFKDGLMVGLGQLEGACCGSEARSVSGNGLVVVGKSYRGNEEAAVMWSGENDFQIVDLNTFLDNNGVDRNGYNLATAKAISSDGTTIVGAATKPFGFGLIILPYRLRLDPPDWAGWAIENDLLDVNTGQWLGWVNIEQAPWIWGYSLNSWIFLPEETITESGSWIYLPKD